MAESREQSASINQIIQFLHYYCDPKNPFDYAVLLRGKWGSGKTHLIKQFLEEREKQNYTKNLYVSLYGISSFEQVDEALYRQLHPILSSKGMKLIASIGKAAIRGALKIDLGSHGNESVTVTTGVPNINVQDYFKTPKECLLIFDDLERCALEVLDILGYINSFVEHEDFKAIIVANEEEILKRYKDKYSIIKEKLVGQTLTITSTAKDALPHFVTLIRDASARDFVAERIRSIEQLHDQSETNNLRILKQALWIFERVASCFTETHWRNLDAVSIILYVILALTYEARSGRLDEQGMQEICRPYFEYMRTNVENPTISEKLEKRYPGVDFAQTLIPIEMLKSIIFDGYVNSYSLVRALDQSPYYAPPAQLPVWKRAWHVWELSDEEVTDAVTAFEQEFAKRGFIQRGEIFHVFGIRLFFSDVGLIKLPRSEVVSQCKKYIDDMRTNREFGGVISHGEVELNFGWDGLGYLEAESAEFKLLVSYYEAVAGEVFMESLPQRSSELINIMKTDQQKFFRELCLNNIEAATYYDIPILSYASPDEFVDSILCLSPNEQRIVFTTLKARYETGLLDSKLKPEMEWLKEVNDVFNKKMEGLSKMGRYRIRQMKARNLDPWLNT